MRTILADSVRRLLCATVYLVSSEWFTTTDKVPGHSISPGGGHTPPSLEGRVRPAVHPKQENRNISFFACFGNNGLR
jgi:hypothetical protein